LAQRYTRRGSARLIITHGLSGSGKTTLARALADRLGAVHIRSDIERKRLFGLQPDQRSGSRPDQGLYSREAGERTYRRLADVAARLLDCGYPVIADATFLRGGDRARFQAIAADRHLPFTLLDVQAPTAVLRTRIGDRFARARDASEADQGVLDNQLRHREPLTAAEQVRTVCIDTSRPQDSDALAQRLLTGSAPAESGAE
jgi:predicted kinase